MKWATRRARREREEQKRKWCKVCHKAFTAKRKAQRFCSRACGYRRGGPPKPNIKPCQSCGQPFELSDIKIAVSREYFNPALRYTCSHACELEWNDKQMDPAYVVAGRMRRKGLRVLAKDISPDVQEIETLRMRLVRAARDTAKQTT